MLTEGLRAPTLRIGGRVAEHVNEDRWREHAEFSEGCATFGAQCVRAIQDVRNPPLVADRQKRNFEVCQFVARDIDESATYTSRLKGRISPSKNVAKEAGIKRAVFGCDRRKATANAVFLIGQV